MRIDIICSDPDHPVMDWLRRWADARPEPIRILHDVADADGGTVLFLVSCSQLIGAKRRALYETCLVLHASDLPEGRGWSPLVWQILEGREEMVLSLLEADDPVDSGAIWAKRSFRIPTHATFAEISACLFDAEIALMDEALRLIAAGHEPTPQLSEGATWYPRRRPEDSRLDPAATIEDQFDLLRVSDPVRYPAYVDLRGYRYAVTLTKIAPAKTEEDQDDDRD
ncbi:formyltransferase family protein [Citreimonas sp.]|uniref:formyltransferase family protein n=1 Tax=Citreimonas sp. TaxID=3036715 RepID=UPI0035C7A431